MKYSIVNYNQVAENFDFRVDAEYFKPEYLGAIEEINEKHWYYLKDIANIKGGKRLPLNDSFTNDDGVPYIRAEDIKDFFVDYEYSPKISYNTHNILKRYQTKYNDILLTIVGNSIGDIGIVKFQLNKCNLTENCAKIVKIKENFTPEFVFVFLISKFGQYQIQRERVGTGQPKLALVRIKSFQIAQLNQIFQELISQLVVKSYKKIQLCKQLYSDSHKQLLKELNLLNFKPEHQLSYIKNYSDLTKADRFDAEYFQPKYDTIINMIKSYPDGWDYLQNIININDKNIKPHNDKKYKYIELSNISNNGYITGSSLDLGKNLPTRARRLVKKNDLIISSIEGSLDSIALITEEYHNSFCSNGFYVLNSYVINSETLLCLMKSNLCQMQLKKGCSGTILSAISKDELQKIIIPKINQKTQIQIQEKIQYMHKLKEQSKQLIEIAVRGVEIAIEQNEDMAANWINNELQKLGLSEDN